MTPKMYQQLVDKIVEAVPEIKETKRGCFIRIEGAEPLMVVSENASPPAVVYGNSVFTPELNFEIIGRPIQLADVLLTLDRNGVVGFSIGARGDMAWNDGNSGASDDEVEFSIWDMRKPLSLQSDETKLFLYNLIVKNG